MSYTVTPLGLQLPVPGSGQAWSTSVYNSNLTKIDAAVTALQGLVGTPVSATPGATGGFTRAGGTFLRKLASGEIEFYLQYTGNFVSSNTSNFATFPAGYRPSADKLFPAFFTGSSFPGAGGIVVGSDGAIAYYGASGAHTAVGVYGKFIPGT